ncbi:transcriptional regulator [Amycolatopsis sp. PS_44_ISF1]|uniref:winged helix-turn-helix domain-containing protein n=1 Tax=Amycolatopsis sp. PS_44_ISF1 TaxID=2974917 RepID=UPI0028DDB76B|nr:transcriptional regulator [Amycolatopsis sp. PS_44_ISF1]MDT8913149.1 transcriptional regulator [Amycolatopsis sp. PS_44_ISF1]
MIERELGSGLREVVHQRVRLGVLAVLDRQGPSTFSQLKAALGQSDGGLGRHLGVLEEHGYIATEKVFENRRPRTWVRMTETGLAAFREEQELLSKLLAAAPHKSDGEDDTGAMAIVFAALLASEDPGFDRDAPGERTDRSGLVPRTPVIVEGRPARPLGTGPISANYDFPDFCAEFGQEQQAQRMMLRSHGLRGGWLGVWQVDREEPEAGLQAHAMVLELGGAENCAGILAAMSPSTAELPSIPDARAYFLPTLGEDPAPRGVAWFSSGRYLVSVVVVGAEAEVAVPALARLSEQTRERLPGAAD